MSNKWRAWLLGAIAATVVVGMALVIAREWSEHGFGTVLSLVAFAHSGWVWRRIYESRKDWAES